MTPCTGHPKHPECPSCARLRFAAIMRPIDWRNPCPLYEPTRKRAIAADNRNNLTPYAGAPK